MPEVQSKIHKLGRILYTVCSVARIALGISAVAYIAIDILTMYNAPIPTSFLEEATDSGIFRYLLLVPGVENSIPHRELFMIRVFAYALSQLFLLHMVTLIRSLIADVTRGEAPFSLETARYLRRSLWQTAFLLLWDIMGAIIIFLFGLLVSYLIEYGAYLQEKANETLHVQEQMIMSFAEITENKSGQTGQHIRRVSEYTRLLAAEMGYSAEQCDQIALASTMHDIGKLLVPSEILDKPGRLTDEEFAVIRKHTTYGGQLLQNVDGEVMQLSRTIALDHHERWDGNGYAQRKAGEEISPEGRIVAVADVYDALTSRRSYKDAWDDREAYDEIVRCSGTQFDPDVVKAFQARYDEINAIRKRLHD